MVFAFFYGLFSESIPLFGSHKRSYIILMSTLQVATCIAIALLPVDQPWSLQVVSTLLFFNTLAMCWTDTIVDGLVVI